MKVMNDEKKPSLEEALEHYGVKGMRWGVRRSEEQLAKARGQRARGAPKRVVKKVVGAQKKAATAASKVPKKIKNAAKAAAKAQGKVVSDLASNGWVQLGATYAAGLALASVVDSTTANAQRKQYNKQFEAKRRSQTRDYATMSVRSRLGEDFVSDWIVSPGGETVARGGWDQRLPNSYSDFTVDPSGVAYRRKSA